MDVACELALARSAGAQFACLTAMSWTVYVGHTGEQKHFLRCRLPIHKAGLLLQSHWQQGGRRQGTADTDTEDCASPASVSSVQIAFGQMLALHFELEVVQSEPAQGAAMWEDRD